MKATGPNPHTQRDEWLEWRTGKIGSSDAAAVLGEHPYQTRLDLFNKINGRVTEQVTPETERFLRWRLKLERPIATEWAERKGVMIRKTGSFVHPDNDRISATPDYLIYKDPRGVGILEIKSVDPHVFRKFKMAGLPLYFFIQVAHQMMVTGHRWGIVVAMNVSTGEVLEFPIDHDEDFERNLLEAETKFLAMCDSGEYEPDANEQPVKFPDIDAGGEVVRVTSEDDVLAAAFKIATADFMEAKRIRDQAVEVYNMAADRMKEVMQKFDLDAAEGFGKRVYYREQAGRRTLDKKALKAAHPEINLDEFMKAGRPFRALRVYEVQEQIEGSKWC